MANGMTREAVLNYLVINFDRLEELETLPELKELNELAYIKTQLKDSINREAVTTTMLERAAKEIKRLNQFKVDIESIISPLHDYYEMRG